MAEKTNDVAPAEAGTPNQRPKDLLVGYWRIKFLQDNHCDIGGRLVAVKKDQVADVSKNIGEHLVANGIAEKVAE